MRGCPLQSVSRGATRCRGPPGALARHEGAGDESSVSREGISVQSEQADMVPAGRKDPRKQPAAGLRTSQLFHPFLSVKYGFKAVEETFLFCESVSAFWNGRPSLTVEPRLALSYGGQSHCF